MFKLVNSKGWIYGVEGVATPFFSCFVNNNTNPSKARFIRCISAVSNAIETIDNEMICFIIYCLNCIRHGRNATYERGLTVFCVYDNIHSRFSFILSSKLLSFEIHFVSTITIYYQIFQ